MGRIAVEVGCGPQARSGAVDGSVSIGIDHDEHGLRTAASRSEGWIFVCADARTLPFRTGTCSSIRLRAVLHHLPPIASALGELARVLARRGQLTIIDGVALDLALAAQLDAELDRAGLPREPVYGFDTDDLVAAVGHAGFVVESVAYSGTATFATPPYVSQHYTSGRFELRATRSVASDRHD